MRKLKNEELGRISPSQYQIAPKIPVVVVLDNIRSLNNVGSFFRTSDAFSLEKIILCGITATPPSKEIHKTALGAEMIVEWKYEKDTLKAVNDLKNDGYHLWAIEQVEQSIMLDSFDIEQDTKYALVFGNEVMGVMQEVVDECMGAIEIPQSGTKHSLNVSVSGGVVLWKFYEKLK